MGNGEEKSKKHTKKLYETTEGIFTATTCACHDHVRFKAEHPIRLTETGRANAVR